MKRKPLLAALVAVALPVTGLATIAMSAPPSGPRSSADPKVAAMASADRIVTGRVAELHAGEDEKFVRTQVVGTPWNQYYVAYERTYRDLPVVGGDFVVATDAKGHVRTLSVAQKQQIKVATAPEVGADAAARASRAAVAKPDKSQLKPHLVVHALGKPRLAWETTVSGRDGKQLSRKKVYVDALTGKRFDAKETVYAGTGTGIWEGPNLNIGTTQSGGSYTMRDPKRPGLTCADYSGGIFSGPDDVWGSTSKTSKEAGCVDVMYAAGGFWDLLKTYGRDGLRNGQWAPARVGLNEVNAYWNGTDAQFGHNQSNQWITSTDVVDHEFGHGLDNFTPGGMSGGGTQEFVGDVWGAASEAFLNNPEDTPDYTVGEEINLVGQGPIRNMYNPSLVNGDPNCYSSSVPNMEVHKAAGPGNHWFYLLAEGSNPGGGKPNSPICSGGPSSVTGIGVLNAAKIFYNAMMLKTSSTSYPRYRTLTLTAAKNLDPSCAWYNRVKDAWNAVQMGAQSGEPSCVPSGNDFSLSVAPNSGTVKAGESVQATVNTTVTSGSSQPVNLSATVSPANPGLTATFNPSQVQSGNTATLTLAASDTAKTGPFTVTVNGTGTSGSHTATYSVNVSGGSDTGNPPDISVENVKAHLQQLQTIATQNGGTRRSTGAGYTASVSYLEQALKNAGFTTARQTCTSGCSAGAGPNLIADWPGGDENNIYMFGAHLDSVAAGPGINDNGSGSAALLEVALKLAQTKPTMLKHVRFGWWTDEEQGLRGSQNYVSRLSATDRTKIKGYFNFDMVGSPNPGYFIDGVNSALSQYLKGYFDSIRLVPDEMSECCSDDGPFRDAGIPTTFLSTGASATKTSAQAQKWGGTAGQAFDRCYHQSCDSYPGNIDTTGLDRSSDAIAWALWKVAVGDSTPANDFSISSDPPTGSVKPGESATATVRTAVTKGSAQQVDLTATVSPGGPTVTLDPTSVTAGGSSKLTVATTAQTAAGSYAVKVTGTGAGGAVKHTTTFTLNVEGDGTNDFSVSVDPATGSVDAGKSATATVRTAVTAGVAQEVNLSATVSPAGPTATVSPSTVKTGSTATLTVATTADTQPGDYTVTVSGQGSVARTATYTLTVKKADNRTSTSTTQYPINDYQRVSSPLQVTTQGQASSTVTLSVDIQHTCTEDMAIGLVSPSGRTYTVKPMGQGQYECTPWEGPMTFTVPGVSSQAAGNWQLTVYDQGPGDTGTLNGWSITL